MSATTTSQRLPRPDARAALVAAAVSLVTMPLTAMWFLLVGGVLLVAGLVATIVKGRADLGLAGSAGLGLLGGPTVYVGLAVALAP